MVVRPAVLVAALSLLFAAPAGAAPAWLPAQEPDPTNRGQYVEVGVGPDGTAVAAWMRDTGPETRIVEASVRLPGGSWGPPRRLSPATAGAFERPTAGVDATGSVTVLFGWAEPAGEFVVSAARAAAGTTTFAPSQTLSDVSRDSHSFSLDVSSSGTAVATWIEATGGENRRVMGAIRDPSATRFDARQPLSAEGLIESDAPVAVDSTGNAVAVWATIYDAGNSLTRIDNGRRPAGGSFTTTGVEISNTSVGIADAFDPDVAMTPDGRATAVWTFNDTSGDQIQTTQRSTGGSWSPPERASRFGVAAFAPSVEVDASNTALGVWTVASAGDFTNETALRPSGQDFGDYENPGNETSSTYSPSLAMNDAGDAIVTWIDPSEPSVPVVGAYRPRGGVVGRDIEIARGAADFSSFPAYANADLDDQGNVVAAWTDETSISPARPKVRVYDVAPPALFADVPATGTTGSPVAMSASASDRWSAPAIEWSFGDGAGAAGGAVAHAFGAAGAFNVTVTARDGAQNATSLTRAVAVTSPVIPPTPRVRSSVLTRWGIRGRTLLLMQMKVQRPPAGAKAQLRCKGKRCPFKRRTAGKVKRGSIDVLKGMKRSKRLLHAGQRLELRITAPGHIGKVVKYRLRKGKVPDGKQRCLPLGATKPQRRCA